MMTAPTPPVPPIQRPKTPPEFVPGDVIASYLYMGTVQSAFWDGTWCYGIGDNASVPKSDDLDGYRIGPKYIRREDIKWRRKNSEWVAV